MHSLDDKSKKMLRSKQEEWCLKTFIHVLWWLPYSTKYSRDKTFVIVSPRWHLRKKNFHGCTLSPMQSVLVYTEFAEKICGLASNKLQKPQ